MSKLEDGQVLIHGKVYDTVALRVKKFRAENAYIYGISTKIVSVDDKVIIMKAVIRRVDDDKVVATGPSEEQRSASTITRTSALENCETSAIGRALAAFGLAGTEFASADEVVQAIGQQSDSTSPKGYQNPESPATDKQKQLIAKKLTEQGISLEEVPGHLMEVYGVDGFHKMTKEQAGFVIDELIGGSNA